MLYFTVQLSGSSQPTYGQLQVVDGETWKAVCDDGFDDVAATVACKTMSYTHGNARCCSAMTPWRESQPIGVTGVSCTGREKKFDECKQTFGGTCNSGKYVTVICYDQVPLKGLCLFVVCYS